MVAARHRRGLGGDRRGVAALEFALIAPVMVIMLLCTIELTNAYRVQAKLNAAAGQLVEMIAAQTTLTMASSNGPGGTLGDMCTGASYNMLPYNPATLSAWIESTTVNSGFGGPQLAQDWASDRACPASHPAGSFTETLTLTPFSDRPLSFYTQNGTPYSTGGTLVVGYTAITLRLTYTYSNPMPFLLASSIVFYASAVSKPRANAPPICTYPSGGSTAACPGVY